MCNRYCYNYTDRISLLGPPYRWRWESLLSPLWKPPRPCHLCPWPQLLMAVWPRKVWFAPKIKCLNLELWSPALLVSFLSFSFFFFFQADTYFCLESLLSRKHSLRNAVKNSHAWSWPELKGSCWRQQQHVRDLWPWQSWVAARGPPGHRYCVPRHSCHRFDPDQSITQDNIIRLL